MTDTPPTLEELIEEFTEETADIVDAILEDGNDPDAVYMIEHHFSCDNFDTLEKAAVACFKKGYDVTDPEELELEDGSTILSFDVTVEMNLDEEGILEDVVKLLTIADSFNLEYDGWGTYPEE